MSLSSSRVSGKVKNTLASKGFDLSKLGFPNDFLEAIINEIIVEIQTNATVSGPVTVTSVTAVTVGAGVSGPGVGTLSGGIVS